MRPDKAKVVDEVWDDARIGEFLHKPAMNGEPLAFSQLLNAYRGMRPADFERFLEAFTTAGGDVHATDSQGRSLLEHIESHEKSSEFRRLLQQYGP